MLLPEDYIVAGALRMARDTGLVERRVEDDGGDIAWEPCGFVGCEDWPDGLEREWQELLDRWNSDRGYAAACERTAAWSWYDRLSVARLN